MTNSLSLYRQAVEESIKANATRDYFATEIQNLANSLFRERYKMVKTKKGIIYHLTEITSEIHSPLTYIDILKPLEGLEVYEELNLYPIFQPKQGEGKEVSFICTIPLKDFQKVLRDDLIDFSNHFKDL